MLLVEFSTLLQLLLYSSLFPCYSLELNRITGRQLQVGFPQLPLFTAETLCTESLMLKHENCPQRYFYNQFRLTNSKEGVSWEVQTNLL